MKVIVGGHELTDQEVGTFRSLIWSQLEHVSHTIPAAVKMASKDTEDMMRYRRLLFQLVEGLDGVKFPESPASLVKIGTANLSNLHIGALITAFSSILDFCAEAEKQMTDPKEADNLEIVKEFASRILYSIIPEEVLKAGKAA